MDYCETATGRLTEPWTNEHFSSLLEGADLATVQLRSSRSQPQSGNKSRKAWAGNHRREYTRVGFAVNHARVETIYLALKELTAYSVASPYNKRHRRLVFKYNLFKFFGIKAFVNREQGSTIFYVIVFRLTGNILIAIMAGILPDRLY